MNGSTPKTQFTYVDIIDTYIKNRDHWSEHRSPPIKSVAYSKAILVVEWAKRLCGSDEASVNELRGSHEAKNIAFESIKDLLWARTDDELENMLIILNGSQFGVPVIKRPKVPQQEIAFHIFKILEERSGWTLGKLEIVMQEKRTM